MYLKQIEQLVVLQKVDDEIVLLEDELKTAPAEVTSLEAKFLVLEEEGGVLNEKIQFLTEQQKRLDGEIETDSLRLKKSKNKLMMVGNNKEYHAMMREMDNLEKQNRTREEEKTAITEELTRQLEARRDLDGRVAALQADLDTAKAGLEDRMSAATARLKELAGLRGEAGQAVPTPVLKRYEFIRSRLKNPVIVPVTTGICSGCHISIPPQSFIELQKGVQILSCPNCQRLIYWSNHVAVEESATEGATEKATA